MTDRRNDTPGWSLRELVGRWVLIAVVDFGLWMVTPGIVVSPWRPQAMAAGIAAAGPVVGTVTIAHLLLRLVGWYLLAVATVMLVFTVGARVLPARLPSPARVARAISLPGTHRLVAWSLGVATLTVPVLAASPSYAGGAGSGRTAAPVMTELGPASAPSAGPPTMFLYPRGSTGAPGVAPFPLTTSSAVRSPSTLPPSRAASPASSLPVSPAPPLAGPPASSLPAPSAGTGVPAPMPAAPASQPASSAPPPAAVASGPAPVHDVPVPVPTPAPAAGVTAPAATAPAPFPTPAPAPAAAPTASVPAAGHPSAPTTVSTGTWVVQPGDHLWSIAERTLAGSRASAPSEGEVAAYWWQVVTVNRPHLPDPADIDLLYPADVVILPVLPATDAATA